MRSDARRNREQILRSARELFLQRGAHVPMEDVAKQAGVGVGTLYRRFPDRYSLLKALAVQNMGYVVAEAEAALSEEPDGWRCISRLVRQIYELRLGDPIPLLLPRLIERARTDKEFQQARQQATRTIATLLDRAKTDGAVRHDLGVADLLTLATARPEPTALLGGQAGGVLLERHLQLVLAGLRPHETEPTLRPAFDDAQVEAFFTSGAADVSEAE